MKFKFNSDRCIKIIVKIEDDVIIENFKYIDFFLQKN